VLQHEWLNARGAIPRFDRDAIEIRVIDVQECPQADLAIAAAATAVIRALYDDKWSSLAMQQAISTDRLAKILHACIRDADQAVIDDGGYLRLLGLSDRHIGPANCSGTSSPDSAKIPPWASLARDAGTRPTPSHPALRPGCSRRG
jgi:hypothetical protein